MFVILFYFSLIYFISQQVATTVFSADLYSSLSLVHPTIRSLIQNKLRIREKDSNIMRDFKQVVADDLTSRFCNDEDLTSAAMFATALDPRFKDLDFLTEEERGSVLTALREKLEEIDVGEEPVAKKQKTEEPTTGLDFLLASEDEDDSDREEEIENDNRNADDHDDEFGEYMKIQKVESNTKVLEWWLSNSTKFPRLSKLAARYMCIPATSVPSERVFSTAGNIINAKRSNLTPENVNMLVFLSKEAKD